MPHEVHPKTAQCIGMSSHCKCSQEEVSRFFPQVTQREDTVYTVMMVVPSQFDGQRENGDANAGLIALTNFLTQQLSVPGYRASVAWGGIGKEIVLHIQRIP